MMRGSSASSGVTFACRDGMRLRCAFLSCILLLAACATTRHAQTSPIPARASDGQAARAAQVAQTMVGKPYRYGGNTPQGFDCSGLVNYSYARAGLMLARDTRGLREQTGLVPSDDLRPGDLVFFNQEGKKLSHVGIYVGEGTFVHAPSSGGSVRTDRLNADYWSEHFVEARRI
jgi:cell wall-associated NlpC family hydrolase